MAAMAMGAQAYWLPNPVITSETVEPGKTTIEWTYDSSIERCTGFQVIVFKMHKATEDGKFVLASSDFDHIESTGTINKHEERGALWDYLPDNAGWWVRSPLYMNKALGIDVFNYYAGSDNSDIFGAAYLLSPDYDISGLTNKAFSISAEMAAESTSVSGGYAVWAWNTNWYDPTNIDYKPVYELDFHYDLPNNSFEQLADNAQFPDPANYTDPEELEEINAISHERTRVMFYGVGYSALWINKFEVAVDMKAGDTVDYAASAHNVEGNSFVIDTTGDTDNDYTYAYEVRPMFVEYDDYRDLTTVRAINYPYATPKNIIGASMGIKDVTVSDTEVSVIARDGRIAIAGASTAQVYTPSGVCVYDGSADKAINVAPGVYIVKADGKTVKVAL